MTLVSNVQALQNRPLTPEELIELHHFQEIYQIDDNDPIVVLLAIMAKNQALAKELPDLLVQKAMEAIALHQQTLREQSTLISKEMLATLMEVILSNKMPWKTQWVLGVKWFAGGAVFSAIVLLCIYHFVH